ncbi:hypothetical protein B1759_04340 [Rubrivirga sp. SAORIC476]|uniref:lactonase family protein n=1 Tax=Rubrivirga sp. SAORIC476 TaxID=1961794 RepID=UPI000BA9A3B1|nr:beta-propeller fold lactonase family protein [Rubrivirga sp. SAORIC476]PAP80615.1 hypothetical protein B1759_04340 [Rubrivirga sp. SAORIC476]
MSRFSSLLTVAALALTLAACDASEPALDDAPATADVAMSADRMLDASVLGESLLASLPLQAALDRIGGPLKTRANGAVYTLSDAAGANEVLVFSRDASGALTEAGRVATGGTGSGGGLGAATDPVVLSPDGRFLYAINRGSDDISVFRVTGSGLTLVEVVPSGGAGPLSLAVSQRLVYVLNTGDGGSIAGFRRLGNGRLSALAGGTAPLPAGIGGPPQIGFSPKARTLVVTDRPSDQIVVYPVRPNGTPGAPVVHPSAGVTPFGFDFDRFGRLFVSDANAPAGPVADGSTVSAYSLSGTALSVIDGAVPTTETAACWVRTLGDLLYVTNTASGTITGFRIQPDGSLQILDDDGVTATTGPNPRDLNITLRFVYAQSDEQLDAFRIEADGSLTPVGTVAVPATARGVAAQ